eukprot:436600-Amphidinium_carterae.1
MRLAKAEQQQGQQLKELHEPSLHRPKIPSWTVLATTERGDGGHVVGPPPGLACQDHGGK